MRKKQGLNIYSLIYMTEKTDMLTINFHCPMAEQKKHIEMASFTLGIGRQNIPWKTKEYRMPWELIPDSHYKGLNFSFNINMDSDIDNYENTKKWQIPKILLFMERLKGEGIIKKYVIVYEYGKYGAKHGKLHYHGLIQTRDREGFVKQVGVEFNKKTNLLHRTVTTKHIKDCHHRETYLKYIKKEPHNKKKCLYYN